MAKISISNGNLTAEFNTLGAELISLKRGNHEYLWQGDPTFWHGQSPLLFPNTGRYWNNRYRFNGKEYEQAAHGFARTTEFSVVEQKPDSVTFGMQSTGETEQVYPFKFFLFVKYNLLADGLRVEWFVRNQGDDDMHFQIGAHPAFFLPDYKADEEVHGYFAFSPAQELEYFEPIEKGCVNPSLPLKLNGAELMPITAKTFDCDTYVIESSALYSCTLCDAHKKPYLTVEFDMPVLALWAPTVGHPDCPFVCIEPWCGSCDTIGYDGQLADRRHEQHLAPGEHFINAYSIKLH